MPLSELPRYSCRKNKSYVTDWPLWQQKRSGRSEDLPERAARPIRIRGALYLRMPFFTLCYWRRFDCGGIVDREILLLPPVQFAIIPVCTGITGSSGFIKTIAPVFRQLPWRILR